MTLNRIAYVGPDGNVFTIRPDGSDSRRLTSTGLRSTFEGHVLARGHGLRVFYTWPTWSPDGNKLAASRVTAEAAGLSFALDVVDIASRKVTTAYESEPGAVPVAQGVPHYIYWAPDSVHLTFIASTRTGLVLYMADLDAGVGPVPLIDRGALYYTWGNSGKALLVHRGDELLLASVEDGETGPLRSLGTMAGEFKAPGLSRDGSELAYVDQEDGGAALYVGDTGDRPGKPRPVLSVGDSSAFLWSPTRSEIAVADTVDSRPSAYGQLTLVSSDGDNRQRLVDEPLIAFFWSPDGEGILYVSYDPDRRTFAWRFVPRSGGKPADLVEFLPSPELLTMITFFDQYAYSGRLWSPDSSQIVFSGTLGPPSPAGRNGGSPEADKVYVVDVGESPTPREIATSQFATWSWG